MDQTKLRKNYVDCRHSDTVPSAQKQCNKKKGRHKGNACQTNYQHPYDMGFAPYAFNLPPQARVHPSSQRLFQATDTSICHYPVPLSFPLEHVSLPFYSTLLQPGAPSPAPLERVVRINRTSEHKIPAMFQTFKQNNDLEQDYTSLPHVNCDLNAKKPKEDDSTSKRRFSDPGLAQISSDEGSGSRSSESSNNSSLQDLHMPYAYGLIEQVNELRENNSDLTRELHAVKLELESLKLLSASWRPYSESLQPGNLSVENNHHEIGYLFTNTSGELDNARCGDSTQDNFQINKYQGNDSIVEVRNAMKVNEEAMMMKMTNLFEKNSTLCNEVHRQLEEKLNEKVNERLGKLEEEIQKLSESLRKSPRNESPPTDGVPSAEDIFLIQQQLVDSEREKLSLRKELQEAIDSRKEAEANTSKLERLVWVLRKKINGISEESCLSEEKPATIRPLSTSFEQNPFIKANINNQKNQQQRRSKKSEADVNENGIGDTGPTSTESTSLTPQVTITGPVTDL